MPNPFHAFCSVVLPTAVLSLRQFRICTGKFALMLIAHSRLYQIMCRQGPGGNAMYIEVI